ncbi:hypothetical protein P152DRAFT_251068 [Eremomyces bilateralis CBS 781.70]|uniref:RanBP2-type domain-containing protein n=1 Tax=Eremomyces bilateralis CBS 781.70 TaxID=1392243 RepID=A0A6G1GBG1_9PEZI|nr:uncharacterized protein P152DRAFT_251068 [Eremomyces bilateralis CBS 781.70]KAF1815276.1 hypothetical protein P152DRAFT_251068 [Eremomyces bilateralis CBS 781.70]
MSGHAYNPIGRLGSRFSGSYGSSSFSSPKSSQSASESAQLYRASVPPSAKHSTDRSLGLDAPGGVGYWTTMTARQSSDGGADANTKDAGRGIECHSGTTAVGGGTEEDYIFVDPGEVLVMASSQDRHAEEPERKSDISTNSTEDEKLILRMANFSHHPPPKSRWATPPPPSKGNVYGVQAEPVLRKSDPANPLIDCWICCKCVYDNGGQEWPCEKCHHVRCKVCFF